MARMIDVGIANGDRIYVIKMGCVMILLGLVGLGCALICQYFAAKASQGFGTVVRSEMFAHINSLSHGEIDQIGTPSLITRITNDVNQLQLAVAMLIRLVVRAPFLVIGATVMAVIIDWKLALIFFLAAPLVAVVLYFIMSRSVPYYRIIQRKLDRISLITLENLSGVRVIRAFSRQEQEKSRFSAASDDQMETSIRVGKISALLNPLTSNHHQSGNCCCGVVWRCQGKCRRYDTGRSDCLCQLLKPDPFSNDCGGKPGRDLYQSIRFGGQSQ